MGVRNVWGVAVVVLASGPCLAAVQPVPSTTYVSSTGLDQGTCPRTKPCHSFNYAINRTAAGGTVIALDVSGYGPFTIGQAITIASGGPGRAYISNPNGGDAIEIDAGASVVHLRGLQIVGGRSGINLDGAGTLDLSDVVISGASNAGLVNQSSAANVVITGSSFVNNATAVSMGAGSLVMKGVTVNGGSTGVRTSIPTQLVGCTIANQAVSGVFTLQGTTLVKGSAFTGNNQALSLGSGTLYLDTTTVTGNTAGVLNGGGTAFSYGNNNITGNTTDVSGTLTPVTAD